MTGMLFFGGLFSGIEEGGGFGPFNALAPVSVFAEGEDQLIAPTPAEENAEDTATPATENGDVAATPEAGDEPRTQGGYKEINEKVKVSSKYATLYCVETGTFLYDKNMNDRINPASTTKILTSIVAIEEADLEEEVTVSDNAVYGIDPSSSHIALEPGEKLKMKDLIYGMLLASGNDCSVAVAEHISGSVEAFSDLMNEKCAEIGALDSHFSNPHGLYGKDHYTTVHDLALIMDYAVQNPTFVEIDSAMKYVIPKTNKKKQPRELWNNHGMVEIQFAPYDPVIGGKNGYIDESKFNLVTYGEKNGFHLIVAVAGSETMMGACEDTEKLMEYAFNNYTLSEYTIDQEALGPLTVEEEEVPLGIAEASVPVLLPKDVSADVVESNVTFDSGLTLPIMAADVVGNLTLSYEGDFLATLPIHAAQDVEKKSVVKKATGLLTGTVKYIAIGGALLLLILILATRSRGKKKRARH